MSSSPVSSQADSTQGSVLQVPLGLLLVASGAQLGLGLWSQSLAVLADTGHLFSDACLLGLVWVTQKLCSQKGSLHRWVTLGSGLVLVGMAVWMAWEAWQRWQDPPLALLGWPMLVASGLNLAVNSWNAWALHQHSLQPHHLQEPSGDTVRALGLHMLGDALGALGVMAAALGLQSMGWIWMDALIGFCVALGVGVSAIPLIGESLIKS